MIGEEETAVLSLLMRGDIGALSDRDLEIVAKLVREGKIAEACTKLEWLAKLEAPAQQRYREKKREFEVLPLHVLQARKAALERECGPDEVILIDHDLSVIREVLADRLRGHPLRRKTDHAKPLAAVR